MKNIGLKRRILLPLNLALAVLLGAFIFNIYFTQNKIISENVLEHLKSTQILFERKLNSDNELMNALIEMAILKNPQIRDAFLARDLARLTELTLPLMKELRSKYRVTHLYFYDTNLVTFLRVHNLADHGDKSKRYIMQKAKESGRSCSGLEIGLFGTFTFRVVQPWRINGEVVGYIQMGERIDHVVDKLHDVLGIELYVTIYKKFLDRKKWEKGMWQYIGREPHWNQFSSTVVVKQTPDEVPQIIGRLLEEGHHEYEKISQKDDLFLSGRRYRYGFIPLREISGRDVGDLVVLADVTDQMRDLYDTILLTSAIYVGTGLAMFVFLYIILGWVEKELRISQSRLIEQGNVFHELRERGLKWELSTEYSSPVRIVIITVISIFIAEFLVTSLLSSIPSVTPVAEMLLHSLLLLGLISPILGFYLLRPLVLHITHRMRLEEELIHEKEKLEKIYESSPDAMVILNKDCRIEYANKVVEKVSGISFQEMKDKHCFEVFEHRSSVCDGCMIEEVMKEKKVKSRVKKIVTGKGIKNWLWQIWYPVLDQKGEIENVVEVGRNITERKVAEDELKKTAKELRNLSRHLQTIREDERTHIAREIHDELGQLLTATKLELKNLSNKLPRNKKYLMEKAAAIVKIIDSSIQTVRKISSDLRPSILDDLGIIPALEDYAEEFQARTGIACDIIFDTDDIALDKKCSIVIFRIFQEALTNVVRHASATKITTHLKNEKNSLILKISDNGSGIAKEKIDSAESYGLIGMNERAQSIGANIKIDSTNGKGTSITLTIPPS